MTQEELHQFEVLLDKFYYGLEMTEKEEKELNELTDKHSLKEGGTK